MAQVSLSILKKHNKTMKLRLGEKLSDGGVRSTGAHKVKFLQDKESTRKNIRTGKDEPSVKYLFEENGIPKYYETSMLNKKGEVNYFVERMAEVKEGEFIILEMKKTGIQDYIQITTVDKNQTVAVGEMEDEDLEDDEEQETK